MEVGLGVVVIAATVGAIAGQTRPLTFAALFSVGVGLCYLAYLRRGLVRGVAYTAGGLFLAGALVALAIPAPSESISGATQQAAGTDEIDPPKPALAVAWAWPWISGCPTVAQVAMPSGGGRIQDFHAPSDVRGKMTSAEGTGGSWAKGVLYIDLSTVDGRSVDVIGIKPHIDRRDLASPQWIYKPIDGCGPIGLDRSFSFDLDGATFADEGVETDMGPPGSDVPTAELGPAFIIDGQNHARIRVHARSCHGNYQWSLNIQYTEAGSSEIKTLPLGPFVSFGTASNTTVYSGWQGGTGGVDVQSETNLTGSDPILCA